MASASTDTTDGIILSELYIIENNVGDVMTESFGGCEARTSSGEAAGFEALAEEAAAQGITYVAATGDTGAAGCDNLGETLATGPVSVSVLASTPFTVAVGGTQFNENGHDSTYWNAANSNTLASAKSYIPENVWNETCTTQCPAGAAPLASGGGGASVFFSKPSWQTGVAGIPTGNARVLPDVSLTAASHDPYLLCLETSCQSAGFFGVSGTSAAAPSFAGIMALIDQKTGSRQGQANYVLYRLAAAETLSQCNGSKTTALPASTCVFNDVTVGNNAVPGETGYGTATAKYQSTSRIRSGIRVRFGERDQPGEQLEHGNVQADHHDSDLDPNDFHPRRVGQYHRRSHSQQWHRNANWGRVLITDLPSVQGVAFLTLDSGGMAADAVDALPGGTNYNVHAHYAGDATFAASDSTPVTVTVSPEASTTTLSVLGFSVGGNTIPFTTQPYGNAAYFRADVAGVSGNGIATGSVAFTDNGVNFNTNNLNSEGTAATAQGIFNIAPGQHPIVATYSGDPGFNSSTSPTVNITVTQAPTATVVTANSATPGSGIGVTLLANVNTVSGGLGPTGTVTFLLEGTPMAATGNPATVNAVSGSGSIQTGAFRLAREGPVWWLICPRPGHHHRAVQRRFQLHGINFFCGRGNRAGRFCLRRFGAIDHDCQSRRQRNGHAHRRRSTWIQRHHQLHVNFVLGIAPREHLQLQSGFGYRQRFNHADHLDHGRRAARGWKAGSWWTTSLARRCRDLHIGGGSRRRAWGRCFH